MSSSIASLCLRTKKLHVIFLTPTLALACESQEQDIWGETTIVGPDSERYVKLVEHDHLWREKQVQALTQIGHEWSTGAGSGTTIDLQVSLPKLQSGTQSQLSRPFCP